MHIFNEVLSYRPSSFGLMHYNPLLKDFYRIPITSIRQFYNMQIVIYWFLNMYTFEDLYISLNWISCVILLLIYKLYVLSFF